MTQSTDRTENKIPEIANDALRASFQHAIAGGTVLFVKEGRVFRQEQSGRVVAVKVLPRANTTSADILKVRVLKRKRNHIDQETVEA